MALRWEAKHLRTDRRRTREKSGATGNTGSDYVGEMSGAKSVDIDVQSVGCGGEREEGGAGGDKQVGGKQQEEAAGKEGVTGMGGLY